MVISREDRNFLSSVPVFKDIKPESLEYIKDVASRKMYLPGEVVFDAGDEIDRLFILGSGHVEIFKMGISGRKFILWRLRDRDVFCLANLYCGKSFVSAQCVDESIIFSISKSALGRLIELEPHVGINLMHCLSSKLAFYSAMVDEFAFKDLTHRLARLLLTHSVLGDSAEHFCFMGLDEMAQRLGSSREVVSRALGRLKQEGLVKRKGKMCLLVNEKALKKRLLQENHGH